jgi:hypothetical protein
LRDEAAELTPVPDAEPDPTESEGEGTKYDGPELPRLGNTASAGGRVSGPARPLNWNLLSSEQAEVEWLELNSWVSWLRLTYGLTPAVLPPFWHRHPELVWELSALHRAWLGAYDPEQHVSGPMIWHHDFTEAQARLRVWVQACGTRLDRDRPTRQIPWPGEPPFPQIAEAVIPDRDLDFVQFVIEDVASRRADEDAYYAKAAETSA